MGCPSDWGRGGRPARPAESVFRQLVHLQLVLGLPHRQSQGVYLEKVSVGDVVQHPKGTSACWQAGPDSPMWTGSWVLRGDECGGCPAPPPQAVTTAGSHALPRVPHGEHGTYVRARGPLSQLSLWNWFLWVLQILFSSHITQGTRVACRHPCAWVLAVSGSPLSCPRLPRCPSLCACP